MQRYVVEVRGLTFATTAESSYGDEYPLQDGPDVDAEVLVFTVSARDPQTARECIRQALQGLVQAELDDEIARRPVPYSG